MTESQMRIDAMEQLVGLDAAEAERYLILATLKHTGGNRTHAANILGISIRTIRNKLHAYAQTDDDLQLPSDEN